MNRGGLEVRDLEPLGGVMLASEPWPTELKSCPNRSGPESRPGQVKEDRGMPISILGSNATATVLFIVSCVRSLVGTYEETHLIFTVVGGKGGEEESRAESTRNNGVP